jgi:glycosyltransferase involved in cell wall biosynthesis
MEAALMPSPRSEPQLPAIEGNNISVALCTHNGQAYLKQQLESIASQTRQPFELIVCDDSSTDMTMSILEHFQQTSGFPMHVHRNPVPLGITRNFEKAMRLCAGEFIALSDQDDLWHPRKLETLAGLLRANLDASGVFSDAFLIDANSTSTGRCLWQDFRFTKQKQELFANDPIAMLLRHDVVTGATMMIRSSVLETFEQIPQSWLHDGWLSWMIALSNRFVLSEEPLTYYRIHATQKVGTGRRSLSDRIRQIRATERDRYRKIYAQFTDLLHYVRSRSANDDKLIHALEDKCRFSKDREHLTSNVLGKLFFIFGHISDYYRYGRGLYSMRKDLIV